VIIADDHTVVRDGIRAVLEREQDEFQVIAKLGRAEHDPRSARATSPTS